ncbi:ABC transporter ATP-binding protein [Pararhizobium sp. DWP3-4]|uniref:ABC transporter ATP-binding protein n=1 Tax=Pararhizobium sp. DWP3-4 TaxID=2804565 RepID=UPI003CE9B357
MSALTIANLCKSFGNLQTLKGIDIALDDGEFLVLLGASGCGKSTLLSIVAGLAEPTSGDVRIDDRTILGVHPKDRNIAMVFQSYALYPNLTVRRNIGFGLEMRKVPKAELDRAVLEAARILQIEPLLDRKPSQLSGGQRQRVAIGRALVRHPRVFLFDEPLSNLDAKLRMEMRTELKRLHQVLRTTVVYVTHDQIEAMTLATRIAVMRNGRVEQLDTPEAIYHRPATSYVATFVGAPPMNMLTGSWRNGGLQIDGSELVLPISRPRAATAKKVIMGIRPEALQYGSTGARLPVKVDVAELTGPELIVTGRIGNQPVVASFSARHKLDPGHELVLHVPDEHAHYFDVETGMRLNDDSHH